MDKAVLDQYIGVGYYYAFRPPRGARGIVNHTFIMIVRHRWQNIQTPPLQLAKGGGTGTVPTNHYRHHVGSFRQKFAQASFLILVKRQHLGIAITAEFTDLPYRQTCRHRHGDSA